MTWKIDFEKLKKEKIKKVVTEVKKKQGTQTAINFTEGLLGLRRGEFGKHQKRIRKFVGSLNSNNKKK